jgi:hypothetical protein
MEIIRELLNDESFKDEHRTYYKFFTRKYAFPFVAVIFIILQKSIKPLQLVLNEFFKKLDNGILVTKSAFTQARRHLKPEAFVTLNQKAVVDTFYADGKKRKSLGISSTGYRWLQNSFA